MIVQMNQAVFHKLNKLFRNAHAIAKHARPFTDFQWMADLDEAKGINCGKTYLNDKNCRVLNRLCTFNCTNRNSKGLGSDGKSTVFNCTF